MSFLLPAQDEDTRRARRNRLLIALATIGLVALVFGGGKSVWAKVHTRKLTAEAEAYLAQGRVDAALDRANSAFGKGARDTRTLRLLLELQGRSGAAQAFASWAWLARNPGLSFEDHRELLRWAIVWGQSDAADSQWSALRKEKPLPVETLRLGAAYFELRGDPERAVLFARESVASKPDDVETRVLLGRVLLRHGSPTDRALGRQLLLEQSSRSDQFGLQVLRLLAASGELLPFEARECLSRLEAHPARGKSDDLALLDLQIQLTPYKRSAIIAQGARDFIASGGNQAQAGRWLLNHAAFELAIELLPLERLSGQTELGLIHLDALCALNRWKELELALERQRDLAPPFERSLLLARASVALGQSRLAELHWTQALEHAQKDPARLLTLSNFATGVRAWEVAERAVSILIEQKPFARRGLVELLQIKETRGDLGGVREVLVQMRGQFPDDPAVENDLAYLDLLEERNIENAINAAERLVKERPEFLSYRVTLALGRLRQGRADEARSLLDVVDGASWEQANFSQRAIYVAALAQTRSRSEAQRAAQGLVLEKLRPRERELIQGAFD